MNIEQLREFCLSLPHVKEDIKWEKDLCFLIGEKMFCVTGLEGNFGASLKVKNEEFDELINSAGIKAAAYLGRYKWIYIHDPNRFNNQEWEYYLQQSYQLVKAKLSRKILKELENN